MTDASPAPTRRAALAGLAVALCTPAGAQGPAKPGAPAAPAEPKVTLRAGPAWHRFLPEPAGEADLWSFGDGPAVPVIRVRHGEEVSARLVNDTTAPLSLHWHGVRGTNATDGVGGLTQPAVAPGGRFDYRFVPPDAGTYLVRPATPGSAGEAAGRGLAALLVVEEREPLRVDADHVLVVRDWRLEPDGELGAFGGRNEAALAGRLGNHLTVEAGDAPRRIVAAPGARLRLRLANACNARIMRLRFDDLKVFVAAVDGQPTDTFEPLRSSLPFPPGTRYDVFVELPSAAGARSAVTALIGNGVALAEIVTEGAAAAPASASAASLPPNRLLPAEIRLQNALRRDLVIAGGAARGPAGDPVFPPATGPVWTLAGAGGSATSPPLFTVRRGQPVVLSIVNGTGFPQPIHIHGHVVRLLHGLDDGWEPYWLDTLQIPEAKVARVAFIADNPGRWAIASTVLERFDTGLWGWFEVT